MRGLNELDNNELDRVVLASDRKKHFTLYRDLDATSTKGWLVKNLLGHGEASALYGASGSGKSALVEDMGFHIAGGLPWLGREVLQGAVCYVALERKQLLIRRAIAFREKHAIDDLPFAVIGGVYDFRDPRTAVAIAAISKEVAEETGQAIALIIIDTLSRGLAGGDENSSKDMGQIVTTTARLQELTKAAIAWVHHVPADGERLRGHGALLGALDTTINVEKVTQELRTATVIKANHSEEGVKINFTLESVEIGKETTAPVVMPANHAPQGKPGEPKLTKNQRTMFAFLFDAGTAGLTTDEWDRRMRDDAGIGVKRKADLVDIRTALRAKHLIWQSGDRWIAKR